MEVRAVWSTYRSSAAVAGRIMKSRVDAVTSEVIDLGASSARGVVEVVPRAVTRANYVALRTSGIALKGVSSSARSLFTPGRSRN